MVPGRPGRRAEDGALPGEGTYDVTVEVEPAEFPRHDERNGDRLAEPAQVRFEEVESTTGSR